jgi:hypothetical protein
MWRDCEKAPACECYETIKLQGKRLLGTPVEESVGLTRKISLPCPEPNGTNSNTSRQIPARVIDPAYDTLLAAPRTLAKFGPGIDRRPTHNSPMNKLYYERADYSVVVKKGNASV